MPTPTIQTLVTDAQQVLNLDSISAVRSVVAVALANANTGTPLNPNLTTQQLWNEFYQVVTKPKSDIESIIANQLMKFLYAPPAPGGVGADKQVIFNDGGVLAGDADFQWDKTLNRLAIVGSQTITGDLTVKTNVLKVDTTNNRVGVNNASPTVALDVVGSGLLSTGLVVGTSATNNAVDIVGPSSGTNAGCQLAFKNGATTNAIIGTYSRVIGGAYNESLAFYSNSKDFVFYSGSERLRIESSGNVGIGATPSAWAAAVTALQVKNNSVSYDGTNFDIGSNRYITSGGTSTYIANGAATMYRQVSGTHLWFYDTGTKVAGTSVAFAQAMALDASGNLLVGTTTANGRVSVDTDLAAYNGMAVRNTGTTYSASSLFFRFINSSSATAGSIQHTAVTTVNYNTASDARLKESKGISTDTSVIDNTVVRDFVWKADGSSDRGVFAQEAYSVKPRAVSVGSDELTEDGSIKNPWSVDYSKFVPDLIVYCQQLKKQVVELTARVQTLEAK